MRFSCFYICLPCRVNDFSLTTRILEIVRVKCGNKEAQIWPYMLQVLLAVLHTYIGSGFYWVSGSGSRNAKEGLSEKYICNYLNGKSYKFFFNFRLIL
jgi:hypothetical protein